MATVISDINILNTNSSQFSASDQNQKVLMKFKVPVSFSNSMLCIFVRFAVMVSCIIEVEV